MMNAIQSKECLVILKFTFIRISDILYISPLRGGEVHSPISICHSKLMITKFILTENLNFSFDGFFLCLARISLPPILFVRSANLLTLLLYNICYILSRLFTEKFKFFLLFLYKKRLVIAVFYIFQNSFSASFLRATTLRKSLLEPKYFSFLSTLIKA